MKTLIRRIKKILVGRRLQGQLRRVISVIACVVVFATTYALVLPAITMESLAQCGIEAHEHTAGCYEKVLVCGQEESEGHTHTDECWQVEKVLICELEEHTHGPECRDAEGNLTCEKTEHTHDENCWREEKTLICGMEETEGHTHTDACYEKQLICGKEVHIHSLECYQGHDAGSADFYGNDDFSADPDSAWTEESGDVFAEDSGFAGGDGFAEDTGFAGDGEFTEDVSFTNDGEFTEDVSFTNDGEFTEDVSFAVMDEFVEDPGFAEEGSDEAGDYVEEAGYAEGDVPLGEPAFTEEATPADDSAYVEGAAVGTPEEYTEEGGPAGEEYAEAAEPAADANTGTGDQTNDPASEPVEAAGSETPDGTGAVNDTGTVFFTEPDQGQTDTAITGMDEGTGPGEAGADEKTAPADAAGTEKDDSAANGNGTKEDSATSDGSGTKDGNGTADGNAVKDGSDTAEAGAGTADALDETAADEKENRTQAVMAQPAAPADLEKYLRDRTGIWYYSAVFDQDGKADTDAISSESITDWKKVEADTILSTSDFLRLYLAYTLPAGTLSDSAPLARYVLPANLHLTPGQIEAINAHENGYYLSLAENAGNAGQTEDGAGQETGDPAGAGGDNANIAAAETALMNHLGAEAIEGGRTPDQSMDEGTQEFISATVKAADIYDEDGNLVSQELVFHFLPYTVEKNRTVYDTAGTVGSTDHGNDQAEVFTEGGGAADAAEFSGSAEEGGEATEFSASEDNGDTLPEIIAEGEEVTGFFTVDFAIGQIDLVDTDTENIKEAEIVLVNKNEKEGIGEVREILMVNTSEDFRKGAEEAEKTDGNTENQEAADAADSDRTADDQTADQAKNDQDDKEDTDMKDGMDQDKDAEKNSEKDPDADQEDVQKKNMDLLAGTMPAQSFEDSISIDTVRPASVGDSGTIADAADVLPARSLVKVRVEADEGTFPAGTTMVLAAVDSQDMDSVTEAVESAVAAGQEDEKNNKENEKNIAKTKTCGFQAVDISFRDADGKEIEPAKPVRVAMTSSLIQEAAQVNSISAPVVVHVDHEGKGEQLALIAPEKIEPAQGRTEEELLREVEKKTREDREEEEAEETKNEEKQITAPEEAEDSEEEKYEEIVKSEEDRTEEPEAATESEEDQSTETITVEEAGEESEAEAVKEADQEAAESSENTIGFETGSFSIYAIVYTVDFYYEIDGKTYEFSIPGGGFVSLEHLVENLGIVERDQKTDENEFADLTDSKENSGNKENPDTKNSLENVDEAESRDAKTSADNTGETKSKNADNTVASTVLNKRPVSDAAKRFVADVESVEFSNPEYVWVGRADGDTSIGGLKEANGLNISYSLDLTEEQIAEINAQTVQAGDWALISLLPFTSEESLTITMINGEKFSVKVTDAQINNSGSIVSGNNYYIYTVSDGTDYALAYNGGTAVVDANDPTLGNDYIWTFTLSNGYWIIWNLGHPEAYLDLRNGNVTGSTATGITITNRTGSNGGFDMSNWDTGGWRNLVFRKNTAPYTYASTPVSNSTNSGSRMRLLDAAASAGPVVNVPHVTVHFVDRNGAVLTDVAYSGTNTLVVDNKDGTFTIPYSWAGQSSETKVDLRAEFSKEGYTYANTHLAGKDASGNVLTHEGYMIDAVLTSSGRELWIASDSGETSVPWYNPSGIILGNLGYGNLSPFSLAGRIYNRPADDGSVLPYALSENKDIYVVLDPVLGQASSGGTAWTDPGDIEDPSFEKTMESNEDGTYTLSLKVDAHASSAGDTNRANVLFVVDTSSSMRKYTTNNQHSRITDTHAAVLDLGQRLLSYNTAHPGSVEVAMLTFDGSVDTRLDWTTETGDFENAVNEYLRYYYLHTGTDWEDAMKEALKKLQEDTDSDPTFVIFFTDGEPSQYTNFSGKGENTNTDAPDPVTHGTVHESVSGGYPDFYSFFLSREASKDEMRAIVNEGARLYGIYAYNTTNEYYTSYNGNEDGAEMLHNAIKYGYNTDESLRDSLFYEAKNTTDLQGAFDAIFNLITESVGFSNVVVKDGIAAGVTSSTVVDGDVSGFTYIIRDRAGALTYKVTVAPNGVTDGTLNGRPVADGTPIFTFADGTTAAGITKPVPTTRIKTDANGVPVTDNSGKIQTEIVNVDVYYYKDVDEKEYIMPISTTGENIKWDLSPLGILQDGYSYEVNFVVWPNQDAYDLVADLNNGKAQELGIVENWESRPILTDSNGKEYRKGGIVGHAYIARYEESGIYSAMSNTEQTMDFYKIDKKIVNGREVTEYTGPYSDPIDPPDPMPLTASLSQIEKNWNVERDPGILARLLYGGEEQYKITFDILQGTSQTPYTSVTLGWDENANDGAGGYVWDPESEIENVDYEGGKYTIGTRWVKDFSIATGLMLSEHEMEVLGLNKSRYTPAVYNEDTYYILEEGHDYTISEPGLSYEFDFISPVYHPMLVDGVLMSVNIIEENGIKKISKMAEISTDENGVSALRIDNTLRGYIHLNKIVVDEDGEMIPSDDTKFEYIVELTNPDPVFKDDHIPWYGINGLFYHDENFNYYQADRIMENGQQVSGVLRLVTEDCEEGESFTATCSGMFNPDITGPTAVTYTDKVGQVKTIQLYGSQMQESDGDHANGFKKASATLKINQGEILNIANVPAGTTYRIVESTRRGYELVGIECNVEDVTIDGSAIEGKIVPDSDNNITYTNKCVSTDISLQKLDEKGRGLEGAVFQLMAVSAEGHAESPAEDIGGTGPVTRVINGKSKTFESAFETTGEVQMLEGLSDGTYRLYEVIVPDGYITTVRYIQFEIENRVMKNVTTNSGDTGIFVFTEAEGDDPSLLEITNTPGASLPATGGPGAQLFYLAGGLMVLLAGVCLMNFNRRRCDRI